jgi:hypothetical protein
MRRASGLLRTIEYGVRDAERMMRIPHSVLRLAYSVFRFPLSVSWSAFALGCVALVLAAGWAPAPQQGGLAVR